MASLYENLFFETSIHYIAYSLLNFVLVFQKHILGGIALKYDFRKNFPLWLGQMIAEANSFE